jgi:hypothetical protein
MEALYCVLPPQLHFCVDGHLKASSNKYLNMELGEMSEMQTEMSLFRAGCKSISFLFICNLTMMVNQAAEH